MSAIETIASGTHERMHINQIRNGKMFTAALWNSGDIILVHPEYNNVVCIPAIDLVEFFFLFGHLIEHDEQCPGL